MKVVTKEEGGMCCRGGRLVNGPFDHAGPDRMDC